MINEKQYYQIKEKNVTGRYVINAQINAFINAMDANSSAQTIGFSVQGRPIYALQMGNGPIKILMWSQMHGNESTTTIAVLDLVKWLLTTPEGPSMILSKCTLKIVPLLNPDGAEAYTRVNANQIDLNRDAQDLSQPESIAIRQVFDYFKPDFSFNLHDQRTIYNVGKTANPATLSFLSPSQDAERSITPNRTKAMQIIAEIDQLLQKKIPGQIGRFDDGFNANCIGDTFQMLNTPTILFEAGHHQGDYEREKTREYVFFSLLAAIESIAQKSYSNFTTAAYFNIPENQKLFFDVLIKNAPLTNAKIGQDLGILFVEKVHHGTLTFEPYLEKQGDLKGYFGHVTYDCAKEEELNDLKKSAYWPLEKIIY